LSSDQSGSAGRPLGRRLLQLQPTDTTLRQAKLLVLVLVLVLMLVRCNSFVWHWRYR
jgi:hypothetical protein